MKHNALKCWFKPTSPLYHIPKSADALAKRNELLQELRNKPKPAKVAMARQLHLVTPDIEMEEIDVGGREGSCQPELGPANEYWGDGDKSQKQLSRKSPVFDPSSDLDVDDSSNFDVPKQQVRMTQQIRVVRRKALLPTPTTHQHKSHDYTNMKRMYSPSHSYTFAGNPVELVDEVRETALGKKFSHELLPFKHSQPSVIHINILEIKWTELYFSFNGGVCRHDLWEPCKEDLSSSHGGIFADLKATDQWLRKMRRRPSNGSQAETRRHRQITMTYHQNRCLLKLGIYFLNILDIEAVNLVKMVSSIHNYETLVHNIKAVRAHIYTKYSELRRVLKDNPAQFCSSQLTKRCVNDYYATQLLSLRGNIELNLLQWRNLTKNYLIRTRFFEKTLRVTFPKSLDIVQQ